MTSDRRRIPIDLPITAITDSGRSKMAEAGDPYQAVAVGIPSPGHPGIAEMARVFVEEFALLGWPRTRIARLFTNPRYAAAYAAYQSYGATFIDDLIDDVLGRPEAGEATTLEKES